jgi:hypothetical protein
MSNYEGKGSLKIMKSSPKNSERMTLPKIRINMTESIAPHKVANTTLNSNSKFLMNSLDKICNYEFSRNDLNRSFTEKLIVKK